jgi:hypothetical protein
VRETYKADEVGMVEVRVGGGHGEADYGLEGNLRDIC